MTVSTIVYDKVSHIKIYDKVLGNNRNLYLIYFFLDKDKDQVIQIYMFIKDHPSKF